MGTASQYDVAVRARPTTVGTARPTTSKIAVVDPHRLSGSAIAALLNDMSGIEVHHVTASTAGLLEVLASGAGDPDLVVLSVHSPPDAGTAAVQLMTTTGLRVLVLRHGADDELDADSGRQRLLDAGALGVLTTDSAPQDFTDAIRTVAAGGGLNRRGGGRRRPPAPNGVELYGFTDAELPILGYVAAGLTDRQIAERTGKKISTVQNQMDSIASKIRARHGNDVAERKRRALISDIAIQLGLA